MENASLKFGNVKNLYFFKIFYLSTTIISCVKCGDIEFSGDKTA